MRCLLKFRSVSLIKSLDCNFASKNSLMKLAIIQQHYLVRFLFHTYSCMFYAQVKRIAFKSRFSILEPYCLGTACPVKLSSSVLRRSPDRYDLLR